ncbi:MAG TPA: sugar-transfer associated ATP-grasp domain-containing protein [Luteitalea sp.]|nr:sugar-transfer associated ATP-grasp domain-containing protein [Luteitalea sp.]
MTDVDSRRQPDEGSEKTDLRTARCLHEIARRRLLSGRTVVRRSRKRFREWRDRTLALWTATRLTRRHGRRVAALTGLSTWSQWLQQARVSLSHGIRPETYYRFKVYRRRSMRDAVLFVPVRTQMALRDTLYARHAIDASELADKRRFYRLSATAGLPIPSTLAEASGGRVTWWPESGLTAPPPCDLFTKQADSMCGAGAARWRWQPDGTYRAEDGSALTPAALVAKLESLSLEGSFVLQRRLANHERLVPLGEHALCTSRILTYRSHDDDIRFLFAYFRMPTADVAADNYALGGLASEIDVTTGILGPGSFKSLEQLEVYCDTHPLTGARITGFQLPDWPATLDLCIRAHRTFASHFSVGWDVALTTHGPVLVEGNYNWDVVLAQQPHGRPLLSHRDFAREYLHALTTPVTR